MDIRNLTYFAEVAYQKSFTKAAQVLNISQPALSKAIRNLEAELDIVLFIRSQDDIALTDEGANVLKKIEPLLSEFKLIQDSFRKMKNQKNYELSIGYSPLLSSQMDMDIIKLYAESAGEVMSISCLDDSVSQLAKRIYYGELDLAVVIISDIEKESLDDVRAEIFHRGSFTFVCVKSEANKYTSLEMLKEKNTKFLMPKAFANIDKEEDNDGRYLMLYTDNLDRAKRTVLEKGFVALVPDVAVASFGDNVQELPFDFGHEYCIAVLTNKNSKPSGATKAMKKIVKAYFESNDKLSGHERRLKDGEL